MYYLWWRNCNRKTRHVLKLCCIICDHLSQNMKIISNTSYIYMCINIYINSFLFSWKFSVSQHKSFSVFLQHVIVYLAETLCYVVGYMAANRKLCYIYTRQRHLDKTVTIKPLIEPFQIWLIYEPWQAPELINFLRLKISVHGYRVKKSLYSYSPLFLFMTPL